MSHPRSVFGVGVSTVNDWVTERDGTKVHFTWGQDTDRFDPLTQIDEVTVTLKWESPEGSGEVIETLPDHRIAPNQFRALVAASRRFEIVAELGALNPGIPVSNEKESWRFIPILRRLP